MKLILTLIPPTVMRNGHIAAASWLVRNTLDGCQATNKITDTGFPRSGESGGLVYLSYCYYLFGCLFIFLIVLLLVFFNIQVLLLLCQFVSHSQLTSVLTPCLRITGVPSLVSNFAERTHARVLD